MTSIAILGGTGHQGSGLARRFAATGARVLVGSRDPDRARTVVAAWNAPIGMIDVASYADAIDQGEVIVIAVPFSSVDGLLDEIGRHDVAGKVAIDVTVPVSFTESRARAIALVGLLPELRAVDVGPLSRARSIEQLTLLAIAINRRHKVRDARYCIVGLPTRPA